VIAFEALLRTLCQGSVDFIVVGGVAGVAHGAARLTQDLDIVYSRRASNLQKLAEALRPYQPYLRGAPPGLPFLWDADTLRRGLNFTLTTTLGPLDLLGDMTGWSPISGQPHSGPNTGRFTCSNDWLSGVSDMGAEIGQRRTNLHVVTGC
jgi:hypothetical protein